MPPVTPVSRPRVERLESLIKKVRALAASALALVAGFHAPVVAVATVNFAALAGLLPVDGVATVDGDRVLLALQTTTSQNGIWVVHAGAWTRPGDWATGSTRRSGEVVNVADGGATFARFGGAWTLTIDTVVDAPGSTPILFPYVDKGAAVIGGGGSVSLADRWIFLGATATATDTTVGAVAAVNVTAVTPGAGFGQANGTITMEGTIAHGVAFVIANF